MSLMLKMYAMYSWASGACSWTISETPTPCSVPAPVKPKALQAAPFTWQKVPAGAAGRSPLAAALSQAVLLKKSMIPTFTPAPVQPAACQPDALVLATSSPTTGVLAVVTSPAWGVGVGASATGALARRGGRMYWT